MAMLLGKKIGMTQVYDDAGSLLSVTVIQAGPCAIMQVKTTETDGYNAVQLGYDDVKESQQKKPQVGHAEKATATVKKFVKEMRLPDDAELEYKAGDSVTVSAFAEESMVDVVGTSKGKGFAGVMKRHGFGNTGRPVRYRVLPVMPVMAEISRRVKKWLAIWVIAALRQKAIVWFRYMKIRIC